MKYYVRFLSFLAFRWYFNRYINPIFGLRNYFFRGDSLQQFCNGIFEWSKFGLSVLGTTTLCFQHNFELLRHTTNQYLATKTVIFLHLFSILSQNLNVPLKSPLYMYGLPWWWCHKCSMESRLDSFSNPKTCISWY